jgi:hypothetical protein
LCWVVSGVLLVFWWWCITRKIKAATKKAAA